MIRSIVVLLATSTALVFGSPPFELYAKESMPELPEVKLCPPDSVLNKAQQCAPLRLSISDLVRDILENSDTTLSLSQYNMEDKPAAARPAPTSVPVSDLFIQNLAVLSETNMSSCLALATCNEHCLAWPKRSAAKQAHELEVIERFNSSVKDTAKGKDDESDDNSSGSTPDFVTTIMTSAQKGIAISKQDGVGKSAEELQSICNDKCSQEFNRPDSNSAEPELPCSPMHYDYTVRINALYRQQVEANVTLTDDRPAPAKPDPAATSPEALYYVFSMRFLDHTNLTACFAQVSCENSCEIYKAAIAGLIGAEGSEEPLPTPPPPPKAASPMFLREDQPHPKAVDSIHQGTLVGHKLATQAKGPACEQCAETYKNECSADRYMIARSSIAIFG